MDAVGENGVNSQPNKEWSRPGNSGRLVRNGSGSGPRMCSIICHFSLSKFLVFVHLDGIDNGNSERSGGSGGRAGGSSDGNDGGSSAGGSDRRARGGRRSSAKGTSAPFVAVLCSDNTSRIL